MIKKSFFLFLIIILCSITGCKSQGQLKPDNGISSQPMRSHHGFENKLLSYVPHNTAFVIASTGQYGLNEPEIHDTWRKGMDLLYKGVYDAMLKEEFFDMFKEFPDVYKTTLRDVTKQNADRIEKITYPDRYADLLGLDKDNFEWVFYLEGSTPVFRMTVKDGEKFKSEFLKQVTNNDEVMEKSNQALNSIPEETRQKLGIKVRENNGHTLKVEGDWIYVNKGSNHFSSDVQSEGNSSLNKYAIQINSNMITFVPFSNEDQTFDIPNALKNNIKPAKSFLSNDFTQMLGNNAAVAVGTVNWIGIFDLIQMNDCHQNVEQYISNEMDNFKFIISIDKNNEIKIDGSVHFMNSDILKEIHTMKRKHIDILDTSTWLGMDISLSFMNILDYFVQKAVDLKQNFEQCTSVKDILTTISEKIKTFKSSAMILLIYSGIDSSILYAIDGAALSVDKFNLNHPDSKHRLFHPEQYRITLMGDGKKYQSFFKEISEMVKMPDLAELTVGGNVKQLKREDMTLYTGLSNQGTVITSDKNMTDKILKISPLDGSFISLVIDSRILASLVSFSSLADEEEQDQEIRNRKEAKRNYLNTALKKHWLENFVHGRFDVDAMSSTLQFHGNITFSY